MQGDAECGGGEVVLEIGHFVYHRPMAGNLRCEDA